MEQHLLAPDFSRAGFQSLKTRANLLDDQVVRGVHDFVGAGRADFHFHARELVEKIRSAPGIDQFAFAIDAIAIGPKEFNLFGVVAVECFGDFRVGADGVAAVEEAVLPHGGPHVFQQHLGWNCGNRFED